MIRGNTKAILQIRNTDSKNEIGERVETWNNVINLKGWLDYINGEAGYSTFNAKVEESSHLFICDYSESIKVALEGVTSENSRMTINNSVYDVLFIDNPMELNQQYEIYLKKVGNNGW